MTGKVAHECPLHGFGLSRIPYEECFVLAVQIALFVFTIEFALCRIESRVRSLLAVPPANSAYWQQISAMSTSGPTWAPIVEDG